MIRLSELWKKRKFKRELRDLKASVRFIRHADDDILTPAQKESLTALAGDLNAYSPSESEDSDRDLERFTVRLEHVSPRKNFFHTMRGLLDVAAVAFAVAFGIRALYLQPFQIPTSSMQPTLYGIHYIDRKEAAPHQNLLTRLFLPLGASKASVTAAKSGLFDVRMEEFTRPLIPTIIRNVLHPENLYFSGTRFMVANEIYTVPGSLPNAIMRYLDEDTTGAYIHAGEELFDGYVSSGDHLFVERLSIHFRKLKRGDVIVFNTENISSASQPMGGYYYIKRLVGLPGDTLKIVKNRLMVRPEGETEFRPITDFSKKFEKLYSGKGGYLGHKADGFLSDEKELTVPADSFFALGDNTWHSFDGRSWGVIPRRNMIGLALNIFWPVSRRWGLVDAKEPLDVPTPLPRNPYQQPSPMRLQ